MTTEYLDLADYVGIAAEVTGLDDSEAVSAVVAIAAGEWDEEETAGWLRARVAPLVERGGG